MKRILCVLAAVIVLTVLAFQAPAFCQEEQKTSYGYGVVTSVGENTITVNEVFYDEETDSETAEDVFYEITPQVKLDNAASVKDIKPGSEIDIEYIETDGKKTIQYIYVYTGEEME